MKVALSRVHFPVTTLGPGRRVGIWFQGCSVRCPGCISMDTWHPRQADVEVSMLLESIRGWLAESDGVTISGGEPFDQPDALMAVVEGVRHLTHGSVFVYSGHSYSSICSHPAVAEGLIDALMSEPFMLDERQTLLLRGSDNQRLHLLTEKGKAEFSCFERDDSGDTKNLDFMVDNDGAVWLAGIPQRGDMRKLQALLASQGHVISVTEGRQ
ncbi:4Fe-4S cluster-binding domain-containing protein [Hydrogenophaga sp. BPS33]|uniref:4Fe-4S cluster-binding domain-containing protein n=1 Tax=Hydrogenophaga sp. BPS33 TaxID=2651974 RepID=UPI00131FD218|nr:4Fe-4S cluster-binding domain-containing protein [Hydrogenophaga sp. BPS33]QHE87219.1 4Fe-4S cluster-binding domain-containing protein [Hydrogenophaga sp. BPS33]